MRDRISEWLSPDNLSYAKGKSRNEIFAKFGNEYEPIGGISLEYVKYLGGEITDIRVYSGKGYFIDHAVNHHPEIEPAEYAKIPDILGDPDDVKLDDRRSDRTSLVFIRKYERYGTVVVSTDVTAMGKIVVHKTFFNKTGTKSPYPRLRSIRAQSPDVAHSSISRVGKPTPGGERDISALDDLP